MDSNDSAEEQCGDEDNSEIVADVFHCILNLLVHLCIGIVSFHMLWPSRDESASHITFHVVVCTIGQIILMPEALLVLSPYNPWSNFLHVKTCQTIHCVLATLGTITLIGGTLVESVFKYQYVKDSTYYPGNADLKDTPYEVNHCKSVHAVAGTISLILLVWTCISGCGFGVRRCCCPSLERKILQMLHVFIGVVTMTSGFVSYCYGFQGQWFVKYTKQNLRICLTVLVAIIGVVSTYISILRIFLV